jgi:hypothetical protein
MTMQRGIPARNFWNAGRMKTILGITLTNHDDTPA